MATVIEESAEAASVSLIGTLRDAQKCAEEILCILGASKTDERPKIGSPSGGTVFQQMDTASALAGNTNGLIHEVLKACHAMQSKFGE